MHGSIAFRWQRHFMAGLNTTQSVHTPTHASVQESEFTQPG